jgi:hypothetical protein
MFRSYDHLQVDIHTLEINTTGNGFVTFRMLVNLVNNDDRFLVSVEATAAVELTVAYSGSTWLSLLLALSMFLVLVVSWIPLASRLAFSCCVANVFHRGMLFSMRSCWSKKAFCSVVVFFVFYFLVVLCIFLLW